MKRKQKLIKRKSKVVNKDFDGSSSNNGSDTFKNSRLSKNIKLYLRLLAVLVLCLVSYSIIGTDTFYIEKAGIIEEILVLASRGADLEAMEHYYYNDVKTVKGNWYFKVFKNQENYYKNTKPLSDILKDVRNKLYLSVETDKNLEERISTLISKLVDTHKTGSLFQGLEERQISRFNNIYNNIEINNLYPKIKEDIILIAEDLRNRNESIKQNSSNSEWGFILSILSIIIASFPIISGFIPNFPKIMDGIFRKSSSSRQLPNK
jgi:hypothetical protein